MAKSSKKEVLWRRLGSTAFAAAVGGVLGVLFAPQSGEKIRQAISKKTKKTVQAVEKKGKAAEKVILKNLKPRVKK